MARLQELLSRSVSQNLGLSDILAKREREATIEAQTLRQIGAIQARTIENVGKLQAAEIGATAVDPLVSGVQAFQKEAPLVEARELLKKKTETDIALTEAKTLEEQNKPIAQTPTQKKILDEQAKGTIRFQNEFTAKELQNLPRNAFRTIGTGDEAVRVVKVPPKLGAEEKTKLAGLQTAKAGIQNVLKQVEDGTISGIELRAAAIGGFKKAGTKVQKAATKIDFNTELLSRSLSGAAVPEPEVVRFRAIFGITKLDTVETMLFKLQRSADMITRIENLVKFGASPFEVEEFAKESLDQIEVEIQQKQEQAKEEKTSKNLINKKPTANTVIKFDSKGRRVN